MKLTPREAVSGFSDIYKFDINERASLGSGAITKIATIPPGGVITCCAIYVIEPITSGLINFSIGTTPTTYSNLISITAFASLTKCVFSNGFSFTVSGYATTLNGFVNNSENELPIFLRQISVVNPVGGSGLVCMRILEPSVFNF